jgi:hypothetical protein
VDRRREPRIGDGDELVVALELGGDRLDERIVLELLLESIPDRLDDVEELVRRHLLLAREQQVAEEVVVAFVEFVVVHKETNWEAGRVPGRRAETDGQYTSGASALPETRRLQDDTSQSTAPPDVVVVGAAARDITSEDRRGWRLGGGVTYGALTVAGLGLRTLAIVGVDDEATTAAELDLMRLAGVDVVPVPLARGPVFENVETPAGRVQTCVMPSDMLHPSDIGDVPGGALRARAWLLAPVAGELGDAWASMPSETDLVALAWQGILRDLRAGERTHRRAPGPSALVRRANLVGVSHLDVEPGTSIENLLGLCRPDVTLVLTDGASGGLVFEGGRERRYPAIPTERTIDPTGAGDVFLAALLAARTAPTRLAGPVGRDRDLRMAAAAASLVVERPGLLGVPDLRSVLRRMLASRATPATG